MAQEALERLAVGRARILYVTNNATKTPQDVAAKVEQVCGVVCQADQVLTSPMAAVRMLTVSDGPVLVVGEVGISEAVGTAGWGITENPDEAGSVMVGMARNFDYDMLAGAASAVRRGARFVATNTDPTFPVADGLLPGAGSMVAAIAVASGHEPEIAGKPHLPMRDLIRERMGGQVWVIGDRLDSDIAMAAVEPSWRSILVMTGVTGPEDDTSPADHVVADISAAVDLILGG